MKSFDKLLFLLVLTLLCSCSNFSMQAKKNNRIRIVNSRGEPVDVQRRVPVFNAEQLQKQRSFKQENKNIILEEMDVSQGKISPEDDLFADKEQDEIKILKKDKATIKAESITPEGNIKVVEKDGTKYLFSEDSTNQDIKAKINKNKTVNLNDFEGRKGTDSTTASKISSGKTYYLQLGAFRSEVNAKNMLDKYRNVSAGQIKSVTINNKKIYRVVLGPYYSKVIAENNKTRVINSGHYDVFITRR